MGQVARAVLANVVHKLKTVKVGHRITDSGIVAWMCSKGLAVADLRYGARAVVLVDDYVGRAMYVWGEHDPRRAGASRLPDGAWVVPGELRPDELTEVTGLDRPFGRSLLRTGHPTK